MSIAPIRTHIRSFGRLRGIAKQYIPSYKICGQLWLWKKLPETFLEKHLTLDINDDKLKNSSQYNICEDKKYVFLTKIIQNSTSKNFFKKNQKKC